MLKGYQARLDNDQRGRAWLAWHTAALPLSKRFPKLESLVAKPSARKNEARAGAEMLSAMRAWVERARGGSA